MAGLRRSKYLVCFYCGNKSTTQYDGQIRQFHCSKCEATNYLDKDGDITDPPVATTSAASSFQYAKPRPSSPVGPTTPSAGTFCDTCMKNQHLFATSLAQYLPDDPDDPEYAERERNYYKFRREAEARYPQVCADCEPKVLQRLNRAGYTAKTDHLRRMLDRSRKTASVKERTPLDVVASLGQYLWHLGLAFELLWHIAVVYGLLVELSAPDDRQIPLLRSSTRYMGWMARPKTQDGLIRLGIVANVASAWWNPRLVQTVRGFTKHITGLSNWYLYQAMIILIRVVFLNVSIAPRSGASKFTTQISAHVFMALFVVYVYKSAKNCVRVDMRPLFGSATPTNLRPQQVTQKAAVDVDNRNMSSILDEILQSSNPTSPSRNVPSTGHLGFGPEQSAVQNTRARDSMFSIPKQQPNRDLQLGSLSISGQSPDPAIGATAQYGDEMDWAPTTSPHRAFQPTDSSHQSVGFGQVQTEPQAGPFWYRVPPAPTNPAQKLRNPPNAPRLRKAPATNSDPSSLFKSLRKSQGQSPAEPGMQTKPEVSFQESRFFPPTQSNDPRNTLTDMFSQSFTLASGHEEETDGAKQQAERESLAGEDDISARRRLRYSEIVVLAISLISWLQATLAPPAYRFVGSKDISVGVMLIVSLIAAHILSDTARDFMEEFRLASVVGAILSLGELIFASHMGMKVWASGSSCDGCAAEGMWLIGTLIAHQVWNVML